MLSTSPALDALIAELAKLPGIGRKTAQRLALHILRMPQNDVEAMVRALSEIQTRVRACSLCCNITEEDPCTICRSPRRESGLICVVEDANDVIAIERGGEYRGQYHVLGGRLSPLEGIGPEDLHVRELLARAPQAHEIILAMNPTVEGEATTLYLSRLLQPLGISVTRIARGIPVGSDLEFIDSATISRAFEGRVPV